METVILFIDMSLIVPSLETCGGACQFKVCDIIEIDKHDIPKCGEILWKRYMLEVLELTPAYWGKPSISYNYINRLDKNQIIDIGNIKIHSDGTMFRVSKLINYCEKLPKNKYTLLKTSEKYFNIEGELREQFRALTIII